MALCHHARLNNRVGVGLRPRGHGLAVGLGSHMARLALHLLVRFLALGVVSAAGTAPAVIQNEVVSYRRLRADDMGDRIRTEYRWTLRRQRQAFFSGLCGGRSQCCGYPSGSMLVVTMPDLVDSHK